MNSSKKHSLWKRILIDITGGILIILAISVGWLPGPGFIPLFIGGLALLAINHEWARRWLHKAKDKSSNFYEMMFPENSSVKYLYDILGILLIFISVYGLLNATKSYWYPVLFIGLILGLTLFLGNRKRMQSIQNWYKKFTHKPKKT